MKTEDKIEIAEIVRAVMREELGGQTFQEAFSKFATKDDLKGFATTDALLSFRDYFQEEIEDLRVEMRTDMLSRKDFFDYMTMFEDALQEMRDHRTGRLLSEKQLATMDDKVANHENRIRVLERHSA